MDDNNIDELLKSSAIFESLNESARNKISSKFTKVNLPANEVLFYQGDPSESMYLLASGKLAAELITGEGVRRIVGHISPGEVVGEMGAISNEPRSLTIKTLTDSVLLKLEAKEFIHIIHQYPSVMFAIIHPLVSRSAEIIQTLSIDKRNKHIIILPANQKTSLKTFTEIFQAHTEKFPSVLVLSDYHPDFVDKNIPKEVIKDKVNSIVKGRKSVHSICYILSSFDTPLAKIAFQRATSIYVTAYADSEPKIDNHIIAKIESRRQHLVSNPNLILLHSGDAAPQNSIDWIKLLSFELYHHVHMDQGKDIQKLLRFIRGKAVGVVLGGGGTRGWAHIGAIKALRESRIPIDIIGGTSVGALVAAIYAMNQSYEQTYECFSQMVADSLHSISWRGLTWPIVSLFSAKKYTNALIKLFGQQCIENLSMPFFCISSNLATNSENIHLSGLLWERIRASTSIPGIVPPMLLDGEIHVDGGLLNNLPVDIMRNFVGQKSRIIAIELNNFAPEKSKYNFPPIFTFKDALISRIMRKKSNYKFPLFVDTFLQELFLSSLSKEKKNAMIANMFVSLDLSQFRMLHTTQEDGEKLVQIGYEETMKLIAIHKDK